MAQANSIITWQIYPNFYIPSRYNLSLAILCSEDSILGDWLCNLWLFVGTYVWSLGNNHSRPKYIVYRSCIYEYIFSKLSIIAICKRLLGKIYHRSTQLNNDNLRVTSKHDLWRTSIYIFNLCHPSQWKSQVMESHCQERQDQPNTEIKDADGLAMAGDEAPVAAMLA